MTKKENLEEIKFWIKTNIKEFIWNDEIINIYGFNGIPVVRITNNSNINDKELKIANIGLTDFFKEIVPFLHSINFIELYDSFKKENLINCYYLNYIFMPIKRIEDSFNNKNGYSYIIEKGKILFSAYSDPDN